MQFMKHVDPKLISPLKPTVSLALTCLRLGLANIRFVSLGVGIHGVQLRLFCKSLVSNFLLIEAISRHLASYIKSRHELQNNVPWESSIAIECFFARRWEFICEPRQAKYMQWRQAKICIPKLPHSKQQQVKACNKLIISNFEYL